MSAYALHFTLPLSPVIQALNMRHQALISPFRQRQMEMSAHLGINLLTSLIGDRKVALEDNFHLAKCAATLTFRFLGADSYAERDATCRYMCSREARRARVDIGHK